MSIVEYKNYPILPLSDLVRNVTAVETDPLENGLERYVGLEHIEPENLHITSWGNVADGTSFTRKFTKGQTLFGKRRAYQRKVAFAEWDGLCSSDILVLEPQDDRLLPELLPFICQTEGFYQHALGTSAGSLSPRTKWKHLAEYKIPLPPLDEQRRIAEILWAADATLESYRDSLRAFITFEKVSSNNLFQVYSVNSQNATYISEQSKAWKKMELGDVSEISYGLTVNAKRRERATQLPYLSVANVLREELNLKEVKTIGCSSNEIERFALRSGDVLVVEGHASVDEIGRSALWKGEIGLCLHQNHIFRVRCGNNLHPEFCVAYLNSIVGRAYFRRVAKSTSGLNTINSQVLRRLPILVPSIKVQGGIVASLAKLKSHRSKIEQHLVLLNTLRYKLVEETFNVQINSYQNITR